MSTWILWAALSAVSAVMDPYPMDPVEVAAPDEAPPEVAPVDAAKDAAMAKSQSPQKARPKHSRPWWSWAGIGGGLATSAVAALVTVVGVGIQVLALYFWVDQTDANRKQAERVFATNRARYTQWAALGLMIGGVAVFFGGLIGATYALGLGNPDAQRVEDL